MSNGLALYAAEACPPLLVRQCWNEPSAVLGSPGFAPEGNVDGENDIRKIRARKRARHRFDDGEQGRIDIRSQDNKTECLDAEVILIDDDQGDTIEIRSTSGSIVTKSGAKLSIESNAIDFKSPGSMTPRAGGTLTIEGALAKIYE